MKTVAYLSVAKEATSAIVRAVQTAVITSGDRFTRLSDMFVHLGDGGNELHRFIASADVVVAHLSRVNPNLLYEIGFAHGLGKTVILIKPDTVELPLDVRGQRTLEYSPGDPNVAQLTFSIREVLRELDRDKGRSPPTLDEGNANLGQLSREGEKGASGRKAVFISYASDLEAKVATILASVGGWEIQAAETRERDHCFDFVIWDEAQDATLAALGNPIAVEVKAHTPSVDSVRRLVASAKAQRLKGVILITAGELPQRVRRSLIGIGRGAGVLLVPLALSDIADVGSPEDLPQKLRRSVLEQRLP